MKEMAYQKKEGMLYTEIKMEIGYIGKYGRMAMKYLQEVKPIRFEMLLLKDELIPMMKEVNKQVMKKLNLLMNLLLEKDPTVDSQNAIETYRHKQ